VNAGDIDPIAIRAILTASWVRGEFECDIGVPSNVWGGCCVEVGMNAFLHHVLAVVTCLTLALPPGSCSAFVPQNGTDSAPVMQSCCHKTVACEAGETPVQSSVTCCCVRDAALPATSGQPTGTLDVAFVPVAERVSLNHGSRPGVTVAVNPAPSRPRLQILLCVWRC